MSSLEEMGKAAKAASRILAELGDEKRLALEGCSEALRRRSGEILSANGTDLKCGEAQGMSAAMLDRLRLTEDRIEEMARGIRKVAEEEDPVGRILSGKRLKNGLRMEQRSVPLGVVGIIYESRPNVTGDAAALCLKAGNAVILRGGKEALASNRAIVEILRESLSGSGLPADGVQLVSDTRRETAREMMGLTRYLDVLIPRGGGALIRTVKETARVPVIETGVGNCHVYVDRDADPEMAVNIVVNGKTSRPSVCNAVETLLVHRDMAADWLPRLKEAAPRIRWRGCPRVTALIPGCAPAAASDWETEFLDNVLAVKVVDSMEEALAHIARYSTGHSETIVTNQLQNAEDFVNAVDSAAVYVNASTRFTDGGVFGLGAEIGISTQKLHARGPMGLSHLTSYKYILRGNGQIR